jgi:hypothetical protein
VSRRLVRAFPCFIALPAAANRHSEGELALLGHRGEELFRRIGAPFPDRTGRPDGMTARVGTTNGLQRWTGAWSAEYRWSGPEAVGALVPQNREGHTHGGGTAVNTPVRADRTDSVQGV